MTEPATIVFDRAERRVLDGVEHLTLYVTLDEGEVVTAYAFPVGDGSASLTEQMRRGDGHTHPRSPRAKRQ